MSSQKFSVHDIPNFVVNYDYLADMIKNYRVSRSQVYQQNLFLKTGRRNLQKYLIIFSFASLFI